MAWLYSIGILLVTSICPYSFSGINARHILKRAISETPLINPADDSTENTADDLVSHKEIPNDDGQNQADDIQPSLDKTAKAGTVSQLNSAESNHKTETSKSSDDESKDGYLKNDDYTDSSDSDYDYTNYYDVLNDMLETGNQRSSADEMPSYSWLYLSYSSNPGDDFGLQQDEDTATYSRGNTDEGTEQDNFVPPVLSLLNSAKVRNPQQIIFQNQTPAARGISSSKLVLYLIVALVIGLTLFKIASTRNRWGNVKVIKITEVDHDDNKWTEYSGHRLDERAKELEPMLMDDDSKQDD